MSNIRECGEWHSAISNFTSPALKKKKEIWISNFIQSFNVYRSGELACKRSRNVINRATRSRREIKTWKPKVRRGLRVETDIARFIIRTSSFLFDELTANAKSAKNLRSLNSHFSSLDTKSVFLFLSKQWLNLFHSFSRLNAWKLRSVKILVTIDYQPSVTQNKTRRAMTHTTRKGFSHVMYLCKF